MIYQAVVFGQFKLRVLPADGLIYAACLAVNVFMVDMFHTGNIAKMPPVDNRLIRCYIYDMKPASPNDSEFVHDALDWFVADYCEDHIVIKIVHNPGAFDVVCSDRHGVNIIFTDARLIPAVEFYAEFHDTKPQAIVEFLAGHFRDEEGEIFDSEREKSI